MSSFIISLDFELYWGVCGSKELNAYKNNLLGVNEAVTRLLTLFAEHDIRATWATVGSLFLKDENEWKNNFPSILPEYHNPKDNTYAFDVGVMSENANCFFTEGSIERLIQSNQEIGGHSYSHFYSLDNIGGDQAFEEDARKFREVTLPTADVVSYVFPRNQVKESHLSILVKNGMKTYRGNDSNRIYEKKDLFSRLLRFADSYVPILGNHGVVPYTHSSGLVNVPASVFLRPYDAKRKVLNKLQVRRIKKSMTACAKKGMSYHLWWHPHNFGIHLTENLQMLKKILLHFDRLKEDYGMLNLTMGEFAKD